MLPQSWPVWFKRPGTLPALIAAAALFAILPALDPAGDHRGGFDGPGLTVDEPFNAGQGVILIDRLFDGDFAGFRRVDSRLPDHPPLGRLWLGLCHEAAFLIFPPSDPKVPYSIACARSGSAVLFAFTLWLIGWCAGRWWGWAAGAAASVSLLLMPRMFGHAHLASLETAVNLAYAACLLFVGDRAGELIPQQAATGPHGDRALPAVGVRRATVWSDSWIGACAGTLLGWALLIKIQAVFLPVALGVWAVIWLRWRAPLWLAVVGVMAFAVFVAGWPYFWENTVERLQVFFSRTTVRATLQVWYQGRSWTDRTIPRSFAIANFFVTVPFGLHLLSSLGVVAAVRHWKQSCRESLLGAGIAVPLGVFSIPGIAVYDGERLFSVVFPLWAMFAGRGVAEAAVWLHGRSRSARRLGVFGLGLILAAALLGLIQSAPAWLSYYNITTRGLSGAARNGWAVTYWGDGLTRSLLARTAELVPPGSTIAVAPTLYELQATEMLRQAPGLRERGIRLANFGSAEARGARFALVTPRPEYLPPELHNLDETRFLAAIQNEGVWLAALIRLETEE